MQQKEQQHFSRRGFLKWGAATAAFSTALTGCGSSDSGDIISGGSTGAQDKPDALLSGGKWVTIPCPECPQFRCVNRAYMVDGIPLRQKSQDDHPHSVDYPTFRACVKGRGMRWSVFSPDRLKYPMKRKHWEPGAGANKTPHLRGKDEWERISWSEAVKIVTGEFRRICETYGEKYLVPGLGGSDPAYGSYMTSAKYGKKLPVLNLVYTAAKEPRFLNWLGYGSMPMYGQNSPGGWPVVRNKIEVSGISGDRFDIIDKAKVIVQWGQNHAWSKYGASQLTWRAAKERGAKIYCVDPWFPMGNNAWVDEWIPVRPGTDSALLLAIAYVLIDEGLAKEDFLFRNTVGYDAAHMPMYDKNGNELTERLVHDTATGTFTVQSIVEDDPSVPGRKRNKYYKLNFKDYILGTYDNTPKTPQWATAICGTPVDKIYDLARSMGNINNPREELVFTANTSTGRHYHGATMAQTFITVSWLLGGPIGGSFGGSTYSGAYHGFYPQAGAYFGQYDPFGGGQRSTYPILLDYLVPGRANPKATGAYGAIMDPSNTIENNYNPTLFYGVAFAEVPRAVKEGKFHNFVHGEESCDIRGMIKLHNGNQSNQNVNTKAYIEAHRDEKVEFVVASDFFMSTETRYADIILPSTTWWENDGHYNMLNPEIFIGNPKRIIEPLFETKSDFEMDELFLKAAGADANTAKIFAHPQGITMKENVLNAFLDTWVKNPDGTKEYLLRFDNDDLNELGINANTATNPALTQGRISYKEFKEKGFYQINVNKNLRQTISASLQNFLSEVPVQDATNPNWIKKASYPIGTETGFYEIFSMNLVNYYRNFWYDAPRLSYDATAPENPEDVKRSQLLYPIAKYRPQPDGWEDATQGVYPLQYVNIHPHHRVHSQRTDNKGILELFDDVLFINPVDAAGMKTGDTVILTSSNGGKIMRRIAITDTVMPGVIVSTEGNTVRHLDDEATTEAVDWSNVIDYGGCSNVLAASHLVGQAHQAYNTIIVKMEKADGSLIPQYKWEPDLPEASKAVISNYYKAK